MSQQTYQVHKYVHLHVALHLSLMCLNLELSVLLGKVKDSAPSTTTSKNGMHPPDKGQFGNLAL
jgi:hypothetical protein